MADRETIAATLTVAFLRPMPDLETAPMDKEKIVAAARQAVTLYETILGMLPNDEKS